MDSNSSEGNDETAAGADRGSPPKTPRWVKVFAIIAVAVIVLVVILLVLDGGEHGPARHVPGRNNPSMQHR